MILPALAYAQNNQGDDQGNGINPGVPNGTYVFTDSGYLTPPVVPSGQVPHVDAGQETFFANGTTSGMVTFQFGGQVFSGVTLAGTFTVNPDGSVSQTVKQTSGPELLLHFTSYPTPDGNTIAFVSTAPGVIVNGVATRLQKLLQFIRDDRWILQGTRKGREHNS